MVNQYREDRMLFALTLTQIDSDYAWLRGWVMLVQATSGVPRTAHVIVLGNEKGGSCKSTTAMHVAVSLLKAGQRVATIDLDSRQKTFTHYVENRRDSATRSGVALEIPDHYCVARG